MPKPKPKPVSPSDLRPDFRPDFSHEQDLIDRHGGPIAGIDEVGRGPLAGPLIAAAAVIDPATCPDGLHDSKKLTPKRRDTLFAALQGTAHYGLGVIEVAELDRINNIHTASLLAMRRAFDALTEKVQPAAALIDGRFVPDLPCPAVALVKGDARALSIAAASIIAKVTRDHIMTELATAFPHYGWHTNAGYGSKLHMEALKTHGITPHHRLSFAPVAAAATISSSSESK